MKYVPSRVKKRSLIGMLLSIGLVLLGLTLDTATQAQRGPMSPISIGVTAVGFLGGIAAFVVNRMDDRI